MSSSKILIDAICDILQQEPSDYAITILAGGKDQAKSWWEDDNLKSCLVLQDGHFGLEARALPSMTRSIREEYKSIKQQNKSSAPLQSARDDDVTMKRVTSCLLLVNPDHATAWADRRRSLLNLVNHDGSEGTARMETAKFWMDELRFLSLLITQHSKAPSSWAHRKFVVNKLFHTWNTTANETETATTTNNWNEIMNITKMEIASCHKVADQFPKNYYAWTHRRWIIRRLFQLQSNQYDSRGQDETEATVSMQIGTIEHIRALLHTEWTSMLSWLERHISDHSAVHYACQILQLLLPLMKTEHTEGFDSAADNKIRPTLVIEALASVRELVRKYKENESLWIFRRTALSIVNNYYHSSIMKGGKNEWKMVIWPTILSEDITKVYEIVANADATSSIGYRHFASSYLVWFIRDMKKVRQRGIVDLSSEKQSQSPKLDLDVLSSEAVSRLAQSPKVNHEMWKIVHSRNA